MATENILTKFITAQQEDFNMALSEIKNGHKQSHWIWYIFPQIVGLGRSTTSEYYAIKNLSEARMYLKNEYLHNNLLTICQALLDLETSDAEEVMGRIDAMKLKSSMTLFTLADSEEQVFKAVLDKFFCGELDEKTIEISV
ncbi:DUF1810 domain-containing protein [uncultured Eubacterium sp.]|uniref:DUF1810 domain-containing protein n=1 Tax=uncultured Eubacterium sp. TaxID=165185 RepID=UPI003265C685